MVQRRRHAGRAGGLFAGARLHGDPSPRLPHLGADAAREGGGARRGVRQGSRPGDAHAAQGDGEGGRAGGDAGPRLGARGAAGRPSHVRDDHLRDVRQVDPELSRPAVAHEPVVQHRALGVPHSAVPADDGVPVAGGAHGARDGGRGGSGGTPDARRVSALPGRVDGDAGDHRQEDREREIRRRAPDVRPRSADAGQQGAPGRHVAQPRPELREGVQRAVPDRRGRPRVRVEHLVGRLDADDRRPGDDPLGRQRTRRASQAGAGAGRDRADLEIGGGCRCGSRSDRATWPQGRQWRLVARGARHP